MKRAAFLSLMIFGIAVGAYLLRAPRKAAPVPSGVSPAGASAAPSPAKTVANAKIPVPAPGVAPSFTAFLVQDAKQLESMSADTAALDVRENEMARKMGEAEVGYALTLALAPEAPANQRILAVDLLGRASPRLTGSALDEIITKGMNSARAEPHTVDELSNVQAKAFAMMAVDAIADKAAKDPGERNHLQQLDAQATDTTIKKHIEERIRTLPPL